MQIPIKIIRHIDEITIPIAMIVTLFDRVVLVVFIFSELELREEKSKLFYIYEILFV